MSDQLKKRLELGAVIVGLCGGIAGLFGAWFVLPYRVQAVEKKIEIQQVESAKDHEILVRIEERVKQLQETVNRK